MFEGIVELILQRAFGEFLEGIEKENLKISIWSGVIRLTNVQLKKSFFLRLNLPVTLKIGILRKLVVNIPWSHLGSQPVIAELEGIYVLLESKPKSEWAIIDTISYAIKKEIIKVFAEQANLIAAEEGKANKKGLFQRMAIRIIDNLQVKITSLHIRLEDCVFGASGKPYAFGAIIESISLITTNEKGDSAFFDRTDSKNKNLPLHKKLNITNISLYWSDNPTVIGSKIENTAAINEVMDTMHNSISVRDYLLKPC